MSDVDLRDEAPTGWFPVATEHDVIARVVFRGQLDGRELAVWRADDGFVNVWENRCLHRGVRLSIGCNDGNELVCRYHAWRYANRSAGCTYIPAHPADAPSRTITAQSYAAVERYGLIWTTTNGDEGSVPDIGTLSGPRLLLRSLPVNASPQTVREHLGSHRFLPAALLETGTAASADDAEVVADHGESWVTITADAAGESSTAVFFVQPVDPHRSMIRGVLADAPADEIPVLRHHAYELGRLVRKIEEAVEEPAERTPPRGFETPVILPANPWGHQRATLSMVVDRKAAVAADIALFELVPEDGSTPPTAQPGAHIDLHLRPGLVRQYSITNGPGETDRYRIAVKRDPHSRGGSAFLYEAIEEGDTIEVSPPHNGFPLRRNIPRTTLIAGGIGITPLIAMAQALDASGMTFDVHYFVAAPQQIAFRRRLATYTCEFHVGLTPAQTTDTLLDILGTPTPTRQVYACGPPPMLDALKAKARALNWPADAVHVEYFENTNEIATDSSFVIDLARSALTLEVPSGSTMLDVLRANDVPIVSSCELGACGSCAATVLGGDPLHQDVYLNDAERQGGQVVLTCVSRASGERLVLDL